MQLPSMQHLGRDRKYLVICLLAHHLSMPAYIAATTGTPSSFPAGETPLGSQPQCPATQQPSRWPFTPRIHHPYPTSKHGGKHWSSECKASLSSLSMVNWSFWGSTVSNRARQKGLNRTALSYHASLAEWAKQVRAVQHSADGASSADCGHFVVDVDCHCGPWEEAFSGEPRGQLSDFRDRARKRIVEAKSRHRSVTRGAGGEGREARDLPRWTDRRVLISSGTDTDLCAGEKGKVRLGGRASGGNVPPCRLAALPPRVRVRSPCGSPPWMMTCSSGDGGGIDNQNGKIAMIGKHGRIGGCFHAGVPCPTPPPPPANPSAAQTK
ncbi:hypothetical protein B0T22DRAFT_468330 [Podospora appendiculata]|uniref:Uncharacterized protein n=1 Tax=Podospora appendiculata TaxID=314037 RepID=A0AAE0X2J5_9PEZI|nr:hypothetical protein B0T22DRAFT_468330 [Podospora appendiculata]